MTLATRLLIAGGGGPVLPAFDPAVAVASTTTLRTGGTPEDWYGRPSIRRRSDGVQVMVYYRAISHFENAGALHISFKDGANPWTAEDTGLDGNLVAGWPLNPPTAGAGEDAGEPWLYDAPNGELILHSWQVDYGVTANGTHQWRLDFDGVPTYEGQVDFGGIADSAKVFATDDHFTVNGVIWAGARVYDDAVPTNVKSILIKNATPNGAVGSWEHVIDLSSFTTDTHECGIEFLGNGRFVVMLRDQGAVGSYQRLGTIAADDSVALDALLDVTATVGIASRQRIYTFMHLRGEPGWWRDNQGIMCGFVHQTSGSSHPRRPCVWIFRAINGGESIQWFGPFYVDASTEDAGYGDLFWDDPNDRPAFVAYHGALLAADLKQWDLTLSGMAA